MNTPIHSNLGDQAIVYAELLFLRQYFPECTTIEVTSIQWAEEKDRILNSIGVGDLVLIHGGGYIGDLWPSAESVAKDIIDTVYMTNPVVLFPNTIYFFDDDEKSDKIRKTLEYYVDRNVYMFLRDKKSYDLVDTSNIVDKEMYSLVPDMVLFLKLNLKNNRGNKVLCCLRNDKEKVICETNKKDNMFVFDNFEYIDTCGGHGVYPFARKYRLYKFWRKMCKTKLFYTDRLHGMYFAAITETPCVVSDNISGKVYDGYEWVKSLQFIKKASDVTKSELDEMMKSSVSYENTLNYTKYYDYIASVLYDLM